ncbi:hypothetical protein EZI54_20775 [Marinobacter halodurans]|uniref:Twin-arginine translocation signal domain-containing protein n=1 Tax=Marinobacter halodurans TaxID=2528979 RepID=A0ABY1ZER3_9GAMM|nr:hypothetical protein [Marinobacter halodurans]TBW48727.1 hypothetical protein EZI54_20775 [Marinobacter halodurans]
MRRRDLLKGAGIVVGLGLTGCTRWVEEERSVDAAMVSLSEQLAELADVRFSASSQGLNSRALYDGLRRSGIISPQRGIDPARLQSLARKEAMIQYQGFYYSPSELALYNLAYLVHKPTLGR